MKTISDNLNAVNKTNLVNGGRALCKISKEYSYCGHCKKITITLVTIKDGKKVCSCFSCRKLKGEPNGELIFVGFRS